MAFKMTAGIFEGKVTGPRKLSRLMNKAPDIYRKHVNAWLWKEKDMFIGREFTPGAFRRKLMRKRIWGGRIGRRGGKTWSSNVLGLFKGFVVNPGLFDLMVLKMGVFYRTRKEVHAAMEAIGEAHTVSSGGYLIIPIYENLKIRGWRTKTGTGRAGRSLALYAKTYDIVVLGGGATKNYYDKEMLERGYGRRALMFIGVRSVRIRRQFDFIGDWKKRQPKALLRGQKRVDRGTKEIERKKLA